MISWLQAWMNWWRNEYRSRRLITEWTTELPVLWVPRLLSATYFSELRLEPPLHWATSLIQLFSEPNFLSILSLISSLVWRPASLSNFFSKLPILNSPHAWMNETKKNQVKWNEWMRCLFSEPPLLLDLSCIRLLCTKSSVSYMFSDLFLLRATSSQLLLLWTISFELPLPWAKPSLSPTSSLSQNLLWAASSGSRLF